MKKWYIVSLITLFAVLTVIYFRYTIVVPSDAFVTRHLATDLYEYFITAHEHIGLLGQGFVPLGDYWVNRGGGYPAVPVNQLLNPSNLLLMAIYTLTGSFAIALRILMPLIYFATLLTAYWFGTIILKRRDASIVLAVAYTFSIYGIVHLEHIDLTGAQPLVLLTLIFLEKLLASPRRPKYIILTSAFLFSVYLIQLYPFYFTVMFIGCRVTFHLLTATQRIETLKGVAKIVVIFLLLAIPFLLTQLNNVPSQQVQTALEKNLISLSQAPDTVFLRSTTDVPIPEVGGPFYIGLVVVLLLLTPIILRKANRMYVFYLLVTLFSVGYAMGSHNPLNIAGWTQTHVPLSFFLRAPGRIMIIGYLSLAVVASIGFTLLVDKVKPYVPKCLLLLAIVILVFVDRTIGYEPPTVPWALTQNGAYEYLKEQPEDFRVVEIPSTYLQMATSSMHTNRDVLSSFAWGHGYFDPQYTFIDIYNKHLQREVTAQEATLYGVKYVIVNTDPQYYNKLHQDLKYYTNPKLVQVQGVADYFSTIEDYKLVYNESGYAIYENLLYRGIVFSNEATIQYERMDPNTIVIDYDSTTPTSIIISQSYADGWIATLDGSVRLTVREFKSVQQIDVPAGSHNITLYYQNYGRWFIVLASCYTVLIAVIAWLFIKRRRFEKCLKE